MFHRRRLEESEKPSYSDSFKRTLFHYNQTKHIVDNNDHIDLGCFKRDCVTAAESILFIFTNYSL